MKKYIAAALLMAVIPASAADIGATINIGQPGFYGQIELGNQYPRPALVFNQPLIIQQAQVIRPPMYLHVPPGHAKDWRKHCRLYGACGTPVYFVQDNWYNNVYVPEYRKHKSKRSHDKHDHDDHRGERKNHGDRDHGHGRP